MNVLLAQLGARMHYAVPRILAEADLLAAFHNDLCLTPAQSQLLQAIGQIFPGGRRAQAAAQRVPTGVPADKIWSHSLLGLRYALLRHRAKSLGDKTRVHLWMADAFAREVMRSLEKQADGAGSSKQEADAELWGGATATYTFNSAGRLLMQHARRDGLTTLMEQTILPRALEVEMLRNERDKHPDFEHAAMHDTLWQAHADCEAEEWELADHILVGSSFVATGLEQLGVDPQKTHVVPYGVEMPTPKSDKEDRCVELPDKFSESLPLRVLFVGQLGLRKGGPYLLEAAQQLSKEPVEFRCLGHIKLQDGILNNLPENIDLRGAVPRSEVAEHLRWADVFCLPSIVEGSATSTYEALAAGLPIITTPNAGSLVCDGEEGWIVEAGNAEPLIKTFQRIIDSPEEIDQRRNNIKRANSAALEESALSAPWSQAAYGARLVETIRAISA